MYNGYMRIAIIAHHRTGSTTISDWLSTELGYEWLNEPFNSTKAPYNLEEIDQNSLLKENILVKYIYHHFTDKTNQIEEIINTYDKVITLTRENVEECAISAHYAKITGECHVNYSLNNNWLNRNKNQIKEIIESVIYDNDKIKNIKSTLHVTYEGIFYTKEDIKKLKDCLKIENLEHTHLIDIKNRYRITEEVMSKISPHVNVLKSKRSLI
jgi:hypothetical protein